MADELNHLKVDLALIKKDVKQIESFFDKIEASTNTMAEISTQLAVQHQVTQNLYDKLDFLNNKIQDLDEMVEKHRKEDMIQTKMLDERLEQYRKSSKNDHEILASKNSKERDLRYKEISENVKNMSDSVSKNLSEQNDRISKLENWKYYVTGIFVVALFLLKGVDFGSIFG